MFGLFAAATRRCNDAAMRARHEQEAFAVYTEAAKQMLKFPGPFARIRVTIRHPPMSSYTSEVLDAPPSDSFAVVKILSEPPYSVTARAVSTSVDHSLAFEIDVPEGH